MATPAAFIVNKNIVLDPNGMTPLSWSGIKDSNGDLIDFSSGWTFALVVIGGNNCPPQHAGPAACPGGTFTGLAGGIVEDIEPHPNLGGIAYYAPTNAGTYVLQGSNDGMTTKSDLAYGSYSMLKIPVV